MGSEPHEPPASPSSQFAINRLAAEGFSVLPVELSFTGREAVSRCVTVSHFLNLVDPLTERPREFAIDQIQEADLGAMRRLTRLSIHKILRSAGHVASIGL